MSIANKSTNSSIKKTDLIFSGSALTPQYPHTSPGTDSRLSRTCKYRLFRIFRIQECSSWRWIVISSSEKYSHHQSVGGNARTHSRQKPTTVKILFTYRCRPLLNYSKQLYFGYSTLNGHSIYRLLIDLCRFSRHYNILYLSFQCISQI